MAAELLHRRVIERITVVTPPSTSRSSGPRRPTGPASRSTRRSPAGGKTNKDFQGVAVTYAGIAVNPLAFRVRTERFKTLVILDEVHHGGDALSWVTASGRRSSPPRGGCA